MRVGDVLAQRFRIDGLASTGRSVGVFYATDLSRNERVAVKVAYGATSSAAERFAREADCLQRAASKSVVRFVAHGDHAGLAYLALEWLDGEDLAQRLQRVGLTLRESLHVGLGAAQALAAVHAASVIHGNVSPKTLFLVQRDAARIKLLDFGSARVLEEPSLQLPRFDKLGRPLGPAPRKARSALRFELPSPRYQAPELLDGRRPADGRSDVFSLGCVLYECLTGAPAFGGETLLEIVARVMDADPEPPSSIRAEVSPAIDALVSQMLAKNPADRPRSGAELASELAKVVAEERAAEEREARRPSALMAEERRLVCAAVVHVALEVVPSAPSTVPLQSLDDRVGLTRARQVAASFGAEVQHVPGWGLVVLPDERMPVIDQVARVADCALALNAELGASLGLAARREVVEGKWKMGEAVAAAAELAEKAQGEILVDAVARELLTGFTLFDAPAGARLEARKVTSRGQHRLSSFVGRRQQIGELIRRVDDAFAARVPRAVVLVGAAGQGKTRISHELVTELHQRHRGIRILVGRGNSIGAGAPLSLAARALRGGLLLSDRDPPERQQTMLEARLRDIGLGAEPWVAAFLGALLGLPSSPHHAAVLAASMRDAALMADGMRSAFCAWLQAEGRVTAGVMLLLEDVQWGDYPSMRLVEHALRTLEGTPLFVFMLARPEVAQVFPQLTRDWLTLELAGLAAADAEQLVRQALGASADPALVARLVAQGGGNPFYLQELARAARSDATRIPETVLSAAQAHLQRLDPVARRLLRAASVFGEIFWPSGVLALLGDWHAEEVVAWLPALVDMGLLEARIDAELHGEPGYRFHHELLREGAYAMLSERDRQGGHRLAAEWLERHQGAPALALAEQWVRGGAPANAVTHYHRAAARALSGNDFKSVIDYADRAIACGARKELRGELSLLAAEALEWATDDEARAVAAADALAHLPKGSDKWFSALHHAVTAGLRGKGPGHVTQLYEELQALSARMLPTQAEIVALARVSGYLTMYGDTERGRQAFLRAEKRVQAIEADSPLATGWLAWARSWQCHENADMAASLEHDLESMFAFEAADDQRNLCYARSNVGYAQMRLGLLEAAEKSLRQALATAERLDLRTIASGAAHNLGLVLALLGNAEQAELMQHRALAFFLQLKSGRGEAMALEYLGRSYLMAGRLDDAERCARRAHELAEEWPTLRALTAASLARVLLARGDVSLARDFASLALAQFEAGGSADGEEHFIRGAFVEVMTAVGQLDEARRVALQARIKLEDVANRLSNESLRVAFLTRVPEHHRLLELCRTLWS